MTFQNGLLMLAVLLAAGCSKSSFGVSRTDAESTAIAVLEAYKAKDLDAIADLAVASKHDFFHEIGKQKHESTDYNVMFTGGEWAMVSGWDGKVEVKYPDSSTALAKYSFIQDDPVVVKLVWENGRWSLDGFTYAKAADFARYSTTRPE